MKAWLILQEGPGAGHSYPLDPATAPVLTIGRSADCDITLSDQRASRHHGDFRWNGQQWEVVDRGSTNGTYVNGMQVHRPYDLRFGDRITIGETTMVLREFGVPPATPVRQPQPARRRGPTVEGQVRRGEGQVAQAARTQPSAGVSVAYWLVQGIAAVAVVCLAAGAFLPWLQVQGSLSQDLQPFVQGLADIVATLSGQDSIFNVTQEISGLEGYGKLTLGIAVIGMITLVVDIFFFRKSVVPGIVLLVCGLVASAAIGFDLINYYRYYEQIQSLTLLFGVQLADVIQVFDQFIELTIRPMIGLPLTAVGLVLLLVAGAGRSAVALFDRG